MNNLLHRNASVGSLIKKILAINPELGVQEIIGLIRESTRIQNGMLGEYDSTELINEDQALELAKATSKRPIRPEAES
jgi:hypothetical protein